MRIAMVSNTSWYLFNFRLPLIRALQQAGHQVVAMAPPDAYSARLQAQGVDWVAVPLDGMSVHPLKEGLSVLALWRLFRQQRVDLVLSYTPKGNLYSALASLVRRNAFAPNVSGLGHAMIQKSWVSVAAHLLYRLTFRYAQQVFFQNRDDMQLFLERGYVRPERAVPVPGSGVDLQRFVPSPLPADGDTGERPVFLFMARLLREKGIYEYVEAAHLVRQRFPQARFQILGFRSSTNPSNVPEAQLQEWTQAGDVEYLGHTDTPELNLSAASCVVLPSYREGMPRVLLEAAACGRPSITTDVPGCRDAVINGETGLLCQVRSASDLADKMLHFLSLPLPQRQAMGQKAREMVEDSFSEQVVIDRYMSFVHRVEEERRVGQEITA